MIEIIGEPRDATEEEIKEYTRKQENPEWQQRMMDNFLRRPMRGQEKKEVTRVMTIAQIQQMKKDMADLIADELLMKVVGIAALIIHDKFGMLMKKEVDGKSREERFIDEWEKQYKLFEAGRMTLEDIQEVLRDECWITMKREDAQHREWM